MTATITLDPSPATAGGKLKAITTGMEAGTILTFGWNPGPSTTGTVNADGECEVDVPDNATSVIVSGGGATPASTSISP